MSTTTLRLTLVFKDADNGEVLAELPELPGVTAHGATQEEARTQARAAARDWLIRTVEDQRPRPGEWLPLVGQQSEPLELVIT